VVASALETCYNKHMTPTKPTLALQASDDNAFRLQIVVQAALREAGATEADLKRYRLDCRYGHYADMRRISQRWVTFA
jgi:hypothetical protein